MFSSADPDNQWHCVPLYGKTEVTRFELITLNFFIFSQKLDEYPDAKIRYLKFQEVMDRMLEQCFFGKPYIQNP